jgi:hypothetical protein
LHVHWPGDPADVNRRPPSVFAGVPRGVRLIRTSPLAVGGRPAAYGTMLMIAPSTESLDAAFQAIRTVHERELG